MRPFEELTAALLGIRRFGKLSLDPAAPRLFFAASGFDSSSGRSISALGEVSEESPGRLRWLTSGRDDDADPAVSPDGRLLLFVRRRGATPGIGILPLDGGEPAIHPPPGAQVPIGAAWNSDGNRLLVVSTAAPSPPSRIELLVRPADAGPPRPAARLWFLDPSSGEWREFARVDGLRGTPVPCGDDWLMVLVAGDGRAELVALGAAGPARVLASADDLGEPRPSPDGQAVALRAGRPTEASGSLLVVDPAGGGVRRFGREIDRPFGDPCWASDGERLIAPVRDAGGVRLVTVEVHTGGLRPFPPGSSEGLLGGLVTDGGRRGALVVEGPAAPPEIVSLDLATGSRRTLSALQPSAPGGAGWGVPEEVDGETDDGVPVAGWLLEPPRRSGGAALVARLGRFVDPLLGFSTDRQGLALAGIAVLSAATRGGLDRGPEVARGVAGDPLGIPALDLLALVAELLDQFPYLEAGRVGFHGIGEGAGGAIRAASRGGRAKGLLLESGFYDPLTLALLSAEPERWAGAAGAVPVDAAPALWADSPLRIAPRLDLPVLLLHGEDDPVAPLLQARLFLSALPPGRGALALYRGGDARLDEGAIDLRRDRLERLLGFFSEVLA